MKELVDKYPDGYEGYKEKASPLEEAAAGFEDKPIAAHIEFKTDDLTSRLKEVIVLAL